ncbi:hypothetical protein EHQ53_13775 [Leptospira langatensis]|uniref:Outer membrane protein beta-barrel domain-containing protein n=1 Tax=Leptospira langatensis TaxID=2484983 RepID=A0A5F1ZTR1_9LEPT|nr:hypothetical protein [Leptospira langatensis]TGK02567.1 hypothetical protein EHO57_04340 [Leptospira langatensis]TGL40232.1 hypothetical protein EHQ53_13775 [Leptospira langatensis]
MKNLLQTFWIVALLLASTVSYSQEKELAPIPGEWEQADRRAKRKIFAGGFTANGLSWFGAGYQFSSKLALSLQWQEQRDIQRFDLDLSGVQSNLSGTFTLTNSEKIQRQTSLQLEWFPFSNPYYFAGGVGIESYLEKQRKTETLYPTGVYTDYAWSISQQKLYFSAGSGFRYIFPSGFFIHLGANLLFYPNRPTSVVRDAYDSNAAWDSRELQKNWNEPEKEARQHSNPYGAQLQILFGLAV